ncbi:MAG: heparinase II/III family protein [Verrucomicrobiota bacterium]
MSRRCFAIGSARRRNGIDGWSSRRRVPAIRYWLGDSPKPMASPAVAVVANNWRIYSESGIAIYRDRDWFLRWDLSPLGYLATAGHGHCDALHLSLWHRGRAVLVDPGTGAYHANRPLRDYLASWRAHNGPHFAPDSFPERRGAFLWGGQHEKPSWRQLSETSLQGTLRLPAGVVSRTITRLPKEDGWQIEDAFQSAAPVNPASIQVLWQFAPTIELRSHAASAKAFDLGPTPLTLAVGASWTEMRIWSPAKGDTAPPAGQFEGICSDAFRRTHLAPCLLVSSAAGRGPWQTTIQAG